ncbi:MAG: dihydroorotase [Flavobacteriales bacterium]|nr:dihydroorotase [Flavobacteriales bacterium]|tara:strand:+ start:7307 stop:8590 length:1284 start_codon:yes stop_codon:yes gene_type:complete
MELKNNIIIRNAKIIDVNSKHHNSKKDVLIINGIIKEIKKNIEFELPYFEIKKNNLHISPGWIDLHTRLGEPGLEHRETIITGLKSAADGGFTSVVVMPNTNPPVDKKSEVIFLLKEGADNIVEVLPTGCVTEKCQQKKISEMYDMHLHGAIAFTDDKKNIQNAKLMSIALEYVKNFKGLIMTTNLDNNFNKNGQINEGVVSTELGLEPSPELSEDLMVMRNLKLLEYTNSKLHLSTISTKNSLRQIKAAKTKKLKVSSDVAAHQLILNDESLRNFDTNLKVMPPLRDELTRKALIKGIKDGIIDAISSDHSPIEIESKKCEFNKAEFGIIGLETVFPITNTILKDDLKLEEIIQLISSNPRQILGIKQPIIIENQKANITLFDPDLKWYYQEDDIQSLSKNSPFINHQFTGKSLGIINKGDVYIKE